MLKKFKIPGAMVIVFICLVIVAGLTWVVPTSAVVENNGVSEVVYNAILDDSGNLVENAGTNPAGIWDVFMAPIKGFAEASNVAATILISGGFLGVMGYVGALDAGIGRLLKKFTGKSLIALLMLMFALMGTVYGTWEEIPAYALVVVPLFVTAGYDVMTGLAVLFVGASIGNMASVVNPYSTGAAVAAIGNDALSLGSGIELRLLIFIVLYAVGTIQVIRYATKVKNDRSSSILSDLSDVKTLTDGTSELKELTKRRMWSLVVFIIMILALVMGYVPWHSINIGDTTMYEIINYPFTFLANILFIGDFIGAGNITPFGDWYFDEFSILFLIGAVIIAWINKLSSDEFVSEFSKGAADLLGVVLVLSIAKGISVLMGSSTSGMSVTFVYWIQGALQGVPTFAFAIACILAYMGIGLFLQSTSGVSGITMPILGSVAMGLFATSSIGAEGGQILLISAFTLGLNFMSGVYPGATVMGTLELVNVPYDRYLKFMLKSLVPLIVLGALILSIAPYLGLI
ncbi:hypothetical protein [Paraclostridium bifermentans]|uniref:hypothetical protein n=1 Tax=Paraclostridium bifermentans TaxID=1490 RepID=UPI00359C73DE